MNIKNWVSERIPSNAIIIEAGAYNGDDTIFFSDLVIDGTIYAFEPVINLYNIAKEKTKDRKNVNLYNLALSDKTGTCSMYVSDLNGNEAASSSFLKPKEHLEIHPHITFKKEQIVNSVNLDEFFYDKNITTIDLMWLDLQGVEPIVLRASPITLSKIRYLYTEVSLIETYEGVELYTEFKKFIESSGFEVIHEDLPFKDMGNVLFKKISI
jgi:FkbM family methyltransferase